MIVTVIRNTSDVVALKRSGLRTTPALTVDDGLHAASRPEVQLLVCDLRLNGAADAQLVDRIRATRLPCPLLLRHDVSRETVAMLYGLAQCDADIRSSYRPYDDLSARIRSSAHSNDGNATPTILRRLTCIVDPRTRDFIGIMAILGERPVMQADVASALGLSRSSFRKWLADRRAVSIDLPRFPKINALFVALHLIWRRERLGWNGKRAAAGAGFDDEKGCANYIRYHLGRTSSQVMRAGGFDALMTAVLQMFSPGSRPRDPHEAVRRI